MTAFVDVRRAVRAWAEESAARQFVEKSEAERVTFELFDEGARVGTVVGRTGKYVTRAPGVETTWRWSAKDVGRDVLGRAGSSRERVSEGPRRPPLPPSLTDWPAKADLGAWPSASPPRHAATPPPVPATARRGPTPAVTSIDDDPRSAFLRVPRRPSVASEASPPRPTPRPPPPPLPTPREATAPLLVAKEESPLATPELPEPVRTLFEYLKRHGSVLETELIGLLGSAREQRKIYRQLDELGLPVQVESVAGVKLFRLKP